MALIPSSCVCLSNTASVKAIPRLVVVGSGTSWITTAQPCRNSRCATADPISPDPRNATLSPSRSTWPSYPWCPTFAHGHLYPPKAHLREQHLVAPADRILGVRANRGNSPEAVLLVQVDGRLLMDARLEPQQHDAVALCVRGEVVDQELAVPVAPKLWPHVHALELAVF